MGRFEIVFFFSFLWGVSITSAQAGTLVISGGPQADSKTPAQETSETKKPSKAVKSNEAAKGKEKAGSMQTQAKPAGTVPGAKTAKSAASKKEEKTSAPLKAGSKTALKKTVSPPGKSSEPKRQGNPAGGAQKNSPLAAPSKPFLKPSEVKNSGVKPRTADSKQIPKAGGPEDFGKKSDQTVSKPSKAGTVSSSPGVKKSNETARGAFKTDALGKSKKEAETPPVSKSVSASVVQPVIISSSSRQNLAEPKTDEAKPKEGAADSSAPKSAVPVKESALGGLSKRMQENFRTEAEKTRKNIRHTSFKLTEGNDQNKKILWD